MQYLKINSQGILVKKINITEQIVLPQEYRHVVYKELHENMGHLGPKRVLEFVDNVFIGQVMKRTLLTTSEKNVNA